MPLWAWIAIGAGIVLVLAALVVAAFYSWRAVERRYVIRLLSRREAVDATKQALEEGVQRLATESDEELAHFAVDPDAVERRALHEVASRALLLADELDATSLPHHLVSAADALGDAAYVIGREAGKVHDEALGNAALDALSSIDLELVAEYYRYAVDEVERVCEDVGVEDAAVYGGGLYL